MVDWTDRVSTSDDVSSNKPKDVLKDSLAAEIKLAVQDDDSTKTLTATIINEVDLKNSKAAFNAQETIKAARAKIREIYDDFSSRGEIAELPDERVEMLVNAGIRGINLAYDRLESPRNRSGNAR